MYLGLATGTAGEVALVGVGAAADEVVLALALVSAAVENQSSSSS